MKTGKEIEAEYKKQFADKTPEIKPMTEYIDEAILEARKEQDKITRHACAEACISTMLDYEARNKASAICMNVKAI